MPVWGKRTTHLSERHVGKHHIDDMMFVQMCTFMYTPLPPHIPSVKYLLTEKQVKIGLATDVAGGYSPSMLVAMRSAVIASRVVHMHRVVAACQQGGVGAVRATVPPPPESQDVLTWKVRVDYGARAWMYTCSLY